MADPESWLDERTTGGIQLDHDQQLTDRSRAAKQNPTSHVIGTDLSAIQPPAARTGVTNCEFIKEDSEQEWLYSHKFDYVHARFIFSCFDDPRKVISESYKNLNPGGWAEFQDATIEFHSMDNNLEGV